MTEGKRNKNWTFCLYRWGFQFFEPVPVHSESCVGSDSELTLCYAFRGLTYRIDQTETEINIWPKVVPEICTICWDEKKTSSNDVIKYLHDM